MLDVGTFGVQTSLRWIPVYLVESTEKAVLDVLKNATPPWSVRIQGDQASSKWMVIATPDGHASFKGVLSDGEHSFEHVRELIQGFLTEFESAPR